MTALETLARKLLRAELAARGARDLDAAEAAIAPRLRFDPDTLEHIAVDVISAKAGHPNADLDEFLAVTMKSNPELFGGQSVAPGRVGQPPAHNPFLPGPRQSLTEGMRIFAADENLGRELMRDAGFKMDLDR
ncbi:hypothetical protein MKL09_14415 [Methylobacterium sp. J-048]|uniref:hypothetical protein n=1 Tax=Methylobacterium sp. J-048 TaxID=2836635 RepID=UPI001FB8C0D8|nr:hypothetical protein [Methylobacterium sp. J-048]MCJ2057745.1 hypothetical protein [Methylobacterium sp. J-048]